ncbi:hypothetical protein M011DRAFT_412978 [Sporormia fimetaria CBS 119925]|uniref:Uncharacterized protein n=1 Tax=Sporormia fimetaria CBS 119925 TaxID=1340428 RepID=A0A6A6UVI5_9PLEO|nr:hypothetical protein M011DRAFT_412978 [Sporormia fimetaria CBS 119925]
MVRLKNRYLVVNYLYPNGNGQQTGKDSLPGALTFHQPTPDEFHQGKLLRAIQENVQELFGEYGMGMVSTSLKINYHSTATSTSIIRCPQAHFEIVWAALTFMTKLPKPIDVPVVVKAVRVSGTIRKAEEEVIRRAKELIRRARVGEAGPGDAEILKDVARQVAKSKDAEPMDVDESGDESESD